MPMARVVSLSILATLIVVLGLTFFRVVAPFLLPLFLAGVTALLCEPLYRWLVAKLKGRSRLAAGITTAGIVATITIPALFGTILGIAELYRLARDSQSSGAWTKTAVRVQTWIAESETWERLRHYFPELPDADQWSAHTGAVIRTIAERTLGFAGAAVNQTLDLVGGFVSIVVSTLMFVIALYYFLADGPVLLNAAEALIPVHVDYQRQLRKRFDQVVRAVVLSTFLAATVQGVLTGGILWAVGFHKFFMLVMLSSCCAMVPLAGTWVVWGPCAVWLAIEGHWGSATIVALFGIAVVGTADNVVRTWVLNSDARLHPLLAFVSVLGGLEALGIWGVFVGPIVASCLHALVQIFNIELRELSVDAFSKRGSTAAIAAQANPVVQSKPPESPSPQETSKESL